MDKRTHITERLAIVIRNGELFFEICLQNGNGVWVPSEPLRESHIKEIEDTLRNFRIEAK